MRHSKLAPLLVCALAHALWVGSAWHAAHHQHELEQLAAAVQQHEHAQPHLDLGADNDGPCPICHVGALHSVAALPTVPVWPPLHAQFAPPADPQTILAAERVPLPPGRGPPANTFA